MIKIENLCKKYGDTEILKDFNLTVPKGSVYGLMGLNGAGKTTVIKHLAGFAEPDRGTVTIDGQSIIDNEDLKARVLIIPDDVFFFNSYNLKEMKGFYQKIYSKGWDEKRFEEMVKEFSLDTKRNMAKFSKGMKMKLAISVALSHNSKLLILDEATSGLDPVIRDDILDMLLDFVQDEEHSILVSSHITSDLEKIADYIVFIHEGKVVFFKPKDELTEQYGIIKCGAAQFDALDKSDIIVYRKMDYEWQILVSDREEMQRKYPKAMVVPATIDEIMLLYVKGER